MDIVGTEQAPRPVGPYSQAVRAGGWVFVSGQIPLDPATGKLEEGGAAAQAERALRNLAAVLAAAGCRPADVRKTTIYLADLNDFAEVNEVYARFFAAPYPARAVVGVASLPKGAAVEIEAVAELPSPDSRGGETRRE